MILNSFVEKSHADLLRVSSKIPLAYLISRGLTLEEIQKYNIGYVTNKVDPISNAQDIDSISFNKWIGNYGTNLKGRLIFPIYNELGDIVAIDTRALDKEAVTKSLLPKYKNSLQSLIEKLPSNQLRYNKFFLEKVKATGVFYGLPHALKSIWDEKTAFLTEGIFDCITLLKFYPNCLTPLTANINDYQINWLKRYVTKLILIFDTDKMGKIATMNIKKRLNEHISVYSINLVKKDVNDYYMSCGKNDLKNLIDNKLTMFL